VRESRAAPALAVALLVLCNACSGGGDAGEQALRELERLVLIPALPCTLGGGLGPQYDCSIARPILIDAFEVTRRDLLRYYPELVPSQSEAAEGFDPELASFAEERLDWPAFLTQRDALELARRRGMRLLTAREWIHVAVGRRALVYPWGNRQQASVANTLELGLGVPAPGGTFEKGRSSPYGCYDMLGNVWEWVSDRVPGYFDPAPRGAEAVRLPDGLVSAMGGSYGSAERRTYAVIKDDELTWFAFHALTLDRDARSPELGVRMGAYAEEYLWTRAGEWPKDGDARERLRALGRRWATAAGREAVLGVLEPLAARPGAPLGLGALAEGARAR
jgi:hypothetical protein